jgi:hypothetical protein
LLQKALYLFCCFESSKLRPGVRHFHNAAANAPGIRIAFEPAAFNYLYFRATRLIDATPYLGSLQSHQSPLLRLRGGAGENKTPQQILVHRRLPGRQKSWVLSIANRITGEVEASGAAE